MKGHKEHFLSLCSICLLRRIAGAGYVSGIAQPVLPAQVSLGAVTSKQRGGYKQERNASRMWWINHPGPIHEALLH